MYARSCYALNAPDIGKHKTLYTKLPVSQLILYMYISVEKASHPWEIERLNSTLHQSYN